MFHSEGKMCLDGTDLTEVRAGPWEIGDSENDDPAHFMAG